MSNIESKSIIWGGDQVNDVSLYLEQNGTTQKKASKSIQIGIKTTHFGDK